MSKIKTKTKSATTNVAKNQHSIDLADYRDPEKFDKIRNNAFKQYQIGRNATYKAVALTYIWYQLSKQNSDYLDAVFKPFSNQSNSHVFTKAVKVCLKLDENTQAPTISKYKSVLSFIDKKYSNKVIKNNSDALVTDIVDIIKYQGGLDACVKALKGSNSSKSTKLTSEQVKQCVDNYKSKSSHVHNSFPVPDDFNIPENNLVLMLARANGSDFEIVDIFTKEDFVKYVIRNK